MLGAMQETEHAIARGIQTECYGPPNDRYVPSAERKSKPDYHSTVSVAHEPSFVSVILQFLKTISDVFVFVGPHDPAGRDVSYVVVKA